MNLNDDPPKVDPPHSIYQINLKIASIVVELSFQKPLGRGTIIRSFNF